MLDFVKEIQAAGKMRSIDFLVRVNQMVYEKIGYNIRMEPGVQTCEQTLNIKTGSCRDFAWLMVQAFRHLGMAARFASGYLVQLTPDQKIEGQANGPEQDFTDLHAWCEVYVPGAGWIGLDATSGLFAGEGHIPLCCTADPSNASPIEGSFLGQAEVHFDYSNQVIRIHEDVRVTRPYTDLDKAEMDTLGNQLDTFFEANHIRLTQGGEPTFISSENFESAQWHTAADGTEKRIKAEKFINGLRDTWANNALFHYGQGKWYPGEPVPRWQYKIFGEKMVSH